MSPTSPPINMKRGVEYSSRLTKRTTRQEMMTNCSNNWTCIEIKQPALMCLNGMWVHGKDLLKGTLMP